MPRRSAAVALRITLVLVLTGVGFVLLQTPFRGLESRAAVSLLRAAGADGLFLRSPTSIQVVPAHHPAFIALVTSLCSSLSSVLAIGCLSSLAPEPRRRRKAAAVLAAVVTVAVGNVLRIAASVASGLVAGRASLVLFHDWVGSMFAFAYTLGGYILLLYLLLPPPAPHPERA